ncbi:MAG: hypothetical protein NWT08_03705 [Akkermansiaceae bacterium]|jgi:hypothetical protein|nr:hypothetical protein [Akkermansiaceae bacterium]MDP4646824.1 hypothetical protein [Akkermansiaceae bacterium]MDP4779740.1 hypothetical protein [Akkermansiaceae bacterium]MDP4846599.1 hypothetical protein [Akkermansiaceae bacterium]MDP4897053.1 hypothetical protein [Akkermansiaceae bacterium]
MKTLSAIYRGGLAISATVIASLLLMVQVSTADIPDRHSSHLSGMYEVSQSSDPAFPLGQGREWFLDFGEGTTTGNLSGTVAVSLRENPNVKVRIMVWQYYPDRRILVIGNQTAQGAPAAVASAIWSVQSQSSDLHLARNNQTIVLQPASRNDY